MRVLIAFDKFKDALSAPAACEIARDVLTELKPDWTIEMCPLADGGEGFATILTSAVGGEWHPVEVTGPRGQAVESGFGLVEMARLTDGAQAQLGLPGVQRLGIVEMATASGLESLAPDERDPWLTDSRGTGQAINAALLAGAEAVLLGVGGSATNDLGVGALQELGWNAVTAGGAPIRQSAPAGWRDLAGFEPGTSPPPQIRIACDVANPLLGPRGATTVFGPQKGLQSNDRDALESEIARVAKLLGLAAGRAGLEDTPGAGAAGGIAYGLLTALEAKLVPGFDLVESWLGVAGKLAAADLVITGEGRFDDSSLEGKGPGSLLARARADAKSVWIFAGAVALSTSPDGANVHAISPVGMELRQALANTPANLQAALRGALTG